MITAQDLLEFVQREKEVIGLGRSLIIAIKIEQIGWMASIIMQKILRSSRSEGATQFLQFILLLRGKQITSIFCEFGSSSIALILMVFRVFHKWE